MFGFQVTGVVLSVTGSIRWGEGVSVIFCQGGFFFAGFTHEIKTPPVHLQGFLPPSNC